MELFWVLIIKEIHSAQIEKDGKKVEVSELIINSFNKLATRRINWYRWGWKFENSSIFDKKREY